MDSQVWMTAAGVILGTAFLFAFFKAVQLNWPESYFGVGELAAYSISASPWRYVLFRFGPVLVTCLFVAVTVDRARGNGRAAAIGVAGLHALLTSGWGLAQALGWPTEVRKRRRPVLMIRLVVLFGVLGIGLVAAGVRDVFAPFIPPLSDISATLWTGAIAGVLGAFIVRVSRGHPVHEHEMVDQAMKEIPRSLWNLGARLALKHDADVDLVRAIMVVETLQRPEWFRRIERVKGRFSPRGTYGIMQVSAEHPLTDEESISKAVRERLSGVRVKDVTGWADSGRLAAFARTYNSGHDYALLLEVAYRSVRGDSRLLATGLIASDNLPVIEVQVRERIDGDIRLEGTAVLPDNQLALTARKGDEPQRRITVIAWAVTPLRGSWAALLKLEEDTTSVLISPVWPAGTPIEQQEALSLSIDPHTLD